MKSIEINSPRSGLVIGIFTTLIFAMVGVIAGWLIGSGNPVTPAGYVGYLTQGAVIGKEKFIGTQNGPTSPGRTWMMKVTNVSITPYTYNEEFQGNEAVLSKDNLRIVFRVHVVWKVRPDKVKDLIEHYSTMYGADKADAIVEDAYKNFLREPLRTFARDEVQQLDGMKIKDDISAIGKRVFDRILAISKETPFEIMSVVVGNIQYPEQVANAVSLKLAATQDLERKKIEIEQAEMDKKKRIVEAEGIAGAMEVVNQKLTPLYIQHEALESQKSMVNSPNHTTIYIPVGPMGVPLVGTFDSTTGTTPTPRQPDAAKGTQPAVR